jgi:rRNA pseudouridine-1189 N-methylase Emg1 (Nep1/Mra1 family)
MLTAHACIRASPMKTAAEYRAMADECFKWAREARADEVHVSLLQLAQVWLDAATNLMLRLNSTACF